MIKANLIHLSYNMWRDRVFAENDSSPREEVDYDPVPTASTWDHRENYALTVEYCRPLVPAQRLLGFLMTTWRPTLEARRQIHFDAIESVQSVSHETKGTPPT